MTDFCHYSSGPSDRRAEGAVHERSEIRRRSLRPAHYAAAPRTGGVGPLREPGGSVCRQRTWPANYREDQMEVRDRKSTRLNSSHEWSSYAVFCLKKKRKREAGEE